jgi:hypothetical protein
MAAVRRKGVEVLKMLLDPIILDVQISPEVIFEAARYSSADVIELLLDYCLDFPATEEFLLAVMDNWTDSAKILQSIIKQYGKIYVTQKSKSEMIKHMDTWLLMLRAKDSWIAADQSNFILD